MNKLQPIDVQKLLSELWANADLSDAQIGKAVAAPAGTINRLRLGIHKDTSSDRAIKIHNFYVKTFAKNGRTRNHKAE